MTQNAAVIEIMARNEAEDEAMVGALTALINEVYAQSEEGLWEDDAERTTAVEVKALIASGEIAVARVGGRVAGSMRLQRLSSTMGEFGMLVAAPSMRGVGIGRQLLEFAERWAVRSGMTHLQLEVLSPREWAHPSKVFLREWYTRVGFEQVSVGHFEVSYPALAHRLATPCDFVIYHKVFSRSPVVSRSDSTVAGQ